MMKKFKRLIASLMIVRNLNDFKIVGLFIILFFLSASTLVSQTTYYWIGGAGPAADAGSVQWSLTPGGVSAGSITPSATNIFIFDGSDIGGGATGAVTMTFTGNRPFGQLILQNNVELAIQSNGSTLRTITVGGSIAGDDFVINSGCKLTVGTNANLTLTNSSFTGDISGELILNPGRTFNVSTTTAVTTVSGTLKNHGTISNATAARLQFASGSTYEHALNGGTILAATWHANSNMIITGITTTNPAGFSGQTFGNVEYNCNGQTTHISLNLGNATHVCQGNFVVNSTGTGSITFISTTASRTMNIHNDLVVNGGVLHAATSSGVLTLNIGGDYIQTGGTFDITNHNTPACIINLNGHYHQSGGTFTQTGTTPSGIYFSNTGQTISFSGGTIENSYIHYVVAAGASVVLDNSIFPIAGVIEFVNDASYSETGSSELDFFIGSVLHYSGSSSKNAGSECPANIHDGFTVRVSNTGGVNFDSLTVKEGGTFEFVNDAFADFSGSLTYETGSSLLYSGGDVSKVVGNEWPAVMIGNVIVHNTKNYPSGSSGLILDADDTRIMSSGSLLTIKSEAVTGTTRARFVINGTLISHGEILSQAYIYLNGSLECIDLTLYFPNTNSGSNPVTISGSGTLINKGTISNNGLIHFDSGGLFQMIEDAVYIQSPVVTGNITYAAGSKLLYDGTTPTIAGPEFNVGGVNCTIEINNSGGVTMSQTRLFSGQPTILLTNGNLNLNDFNLRIYNIAGGHANSFINTNGNGYVEHQFSTSFKSLPVGNDDDFMPIEFRITDASFPPTQLFQIRVKYPSPGMPPTGLAKVWELKAGTSRNISPVFTWNAQVNNLIYNPPHNVPTTLYRYIPSAWSDLSFAPTSIDIYEASYAGFASGTNTFELTPAVTTNILPVELLQFTAHCSNNGNILQWTTASEHHNDFFRVERSTDGVQFETIGTQQGAGNSNSILHYEFRDAVVFGGIIYYRLIQLDFDGTQTVYGPIAVNCVETGAEQTAIFKVYPNPFRDIFTTYYSHGADEAAIISIYDSFGKLIYLELVNEATHRIVLENLAKGLYVMHFRTNSFFKTVEIIKE